MGAKAGKDLGLWGNPAKPTTLGPGQSGTTGGTEGGMVPSGMPDSATGPSTVAPQTGTALPSTMAPETVPGAITETTLPSVPVSSGAPPLFGATSETALDATAGSALTTGTALTTAAPAETAALTSTAVLNASEGVATGAVEGAAGAAGLEGGLLGASAFLGPAGLIVGGLGIAATLIFGGKKGGCCFIFIEGEGELTETVRKYRDEHYLNTPVALGYKGMASWLVPLMKRHRWVKEMVRFTMTRPLSRYAEWYYGQNSYGWVMWPLKSFWTSTWGFYGKLILSILPRIVEV